MKKLLFIAALFGFSFTARAADLPASAPFYKAPSVAAAYNWTGFYAGVNVGYGWTKVKPGDISFFDPAFAGSITGIDYSPKGVIGGAQAGYNYQMNNFLVGLEADISASGIKGSVTDPVNAYTVTSKIDWLATARGRVGVVMDRTLLYATGGLAVARVKTTLDDLYLAGVVTTSSGATYVGWTAGVGAEFAVAPQWTVKAEYLYMDFGSKDYNFYEGAAGWQRISGSASLTANVARIGANYRF